MRIVQRLWQDDAGFIVSAELILIATIVVIGLIVGLASVRDALVSELSDVAGAIQNINESYAFFGVAGHSAETAGSTFVDELDFCDSATDPDGAVDNCITINRDPSAEGTFTFVPNP